MKFKNISSLSWYSTHKKFIQNEFNGIYYSFTVAHKNTSFEKSKQKLHLIKFIDSRIYQLTLRSRIFHKQTNTQHKTNHHPFISFFDSSSLSIYFYIQIQFFCEIKFTYQLVIYNIYTYFIYTSAN